MQYDITGHSGDGFNIAVVQNDNVPKNNKQRLEILKVNLYWMKFLDICVVPGIPEREPSGTGSVKV